MSNHKFTDKIKDKYKTENILFPLFSFKYYNDKHSVYSFKYLNANVRLKEGALNGLVDLLTKLSKMSLVDIGKLPKQSGYETFDYTEFAESFVNTVQQNKELHKQGNALNGIKLTVFRVKNPASDNDYRMICKQDNYHQGSAHVFYILGFDFNFSAYTHG